MVVFITFELGHRFDFSSGESYSCTAIFPPISALDPIVFWYYSPWDLWVRQSGQYRKYALLTGYLASGVLLIVFILLGGDLFLPTFAAITVLVNISFTGLIVYRLLRHQSRVRKLLGDDYGSPYNTLIGICVESCALIVILNVIFLALSLQTNNLTGLQAYGSKIPAVLFIQAAVSTVDFMKLIYID